MHTVETDWWLLDLPEEWQAEQDDETIVITDEDGVGVLEITSLEPDNDGQRVDLHALAKQLVPDGLAGSAARLGDFEGLYFQYQEEGDAVREWVLQCDNRLLLVSYSCDIDDAGMDDSFVDEVLDTLESKKPGDEKSETKH
ncbi:MAG TPA: hypothetical protein VLC91_15315 [Spongiibacteraceae bacterium]|nr:hypothetical protein [Spongiibacteraceae bacterium]